MEIKTVYRNEITDSLLNKLSELVIEWFGGDLTLWIKRFNFAWAENPYITDEYPICWVLVNENNEFLGFQANYIVPYQHNNKIIFACAAGATYVKSEARGVISTAFCLYPIRQKNIQIYLSTTPNITAVKLLSNAGLHHVKNTSKDGYSVNNYMIPLNLKKFLSMASWIANHFSKPETGLKRKLLELSSKISQCVSLIIPNGNPLKRESMLFFGNYQLKLCISSKEFVDKLSSHKKGDTIELSKDETTLSWILFSNAVQELLHRTTMQIFTKSGEYCGYLIYDFQHAGPETTLRIRELQLLKPDDAIIKLILKHAKIEARNHGCAAVYSALQNPDPEVDKLLGRHILLHLKTDNRYYVKFKKGVFTDIDPYSIYVPSDLDPDVGFV